MAGSTNGIIHRVRHLLRQSDPTPDAELLARFVADRDAEAFALLVRRHGGMVHGVCRRVLRNAADADDAFQATFLVLARRAGAIRPQGLLGNWLYGVAYRTALEAKRAAAVRRARERRAAEMKTSAPAGDSPHPDLREVLDRELAALPDVYRAAVVLCDLEGLSRKDAAERLGWPEGTLSGRLFRARSLLAARLSRLGLAVPVAGIGVAAGGASAGVPVALAESTIRIGALVAAGEAVAVAAAPVAALTEGVMKAMLLTKLKGMATALVVSCAVLATGVAGWQANAVVAADGQARGAAARDPDKDRIAQLERERDELLKVVRELKDRLAKLEANQGERPRRVVIEDKDVLDRQKVLEEVAKQRAEEIARQAAERAKWTEADVAKLREWAAQAKPAGDPKPRVVAGGPPLEVIEKLKKLEQELANDPKAREKVREALRDLEEKLKGLEGKRVMVVDAEQLAKLKAQGVAPAIPAKPAKPAIPAKPATAAKPSAVAGDRVAELEDRVKRMEADLKKLLAELERQRKSK